MQDKELYQQILGLDSPWTVSRIDLDIELGEIRVHVEDPRRHHRGHRHHGCTWGTVATVDVADDPFHLVAGVQPGGILGLVGRPAGKNPLYVQREGLEKGRNWQKTESSEVAETLVFTVFSCVCGLSAFDFEDREGHQPAKHFRGLSPYKSLQSALCPQAVVLKILVF
jgi:hypothetical protein